MYIIVYVSSLLGTAGYFSKKCYDFKFIYLIAAIMPLWNTYLAIKYFSLDFGSVLDAIKDYFIWGK